MFLNIWDYSDQVSIRSAIETQLIWSVIYTYTKTFSFQKSQSCDSTILKNKFRKILNWWSSFSSGSFFLAEWFHITQLQMGFFSRVVFVSTSCLIHHDNSSQPCCTWNVTRTVLLHVMPRAHPPLVRGQGKTILKQESAAPTIFLPLN